MSAIKNATVLSLIATAIDHASREEAIRKLNALKASEAIGEAEALEALDALKAMVFEAKSSSKKASWMTEEDEELVIQRPEGFLEKEDMVKMSITSVILAMKFYKDGGKTLLVLGDDPILNTLAICDALMGEGSGGR